MDRETLQKNLVFLFEFYMSGLTFNRDYELKVSTKIDQKAIDNFILWLEKKSQRVAVSDDYLLDYFTFAFSWYIYIKEIEVSSKYGAKAIQISWILGQAQRDRWDKFTKNNADNYVFIISKDKQKFTADYKLNYTQVNKWFYTPKPSQMVALVKHEEVARQRYFNTDAGFAFCSERTFLYNHLSQFCNSCKEQKMCKDTLKSDFPLIFEARGYGQTVE